MALACGTRLWFILEMRDHPFSVISTQTIDSWYYHTWALDILRGNFWGNDVFFLRPLYPYLLAGLYAVFGPNVLAVQLFQCILATASCYLLYDSTRRIFGRTPALLTAFGFALTGILVFYTGALLYVEITIFFSLLTLWLILRNIRLLSAPPSPQKHSKHIWQWAFTGTSLGLLVICRPEMLLLLPAFVLLLFFPSAGTGQTPLSVSSPNLTDSRISPVLTKEAGRKRLQAILALSLGTLLTVAILPVRNFLVAREPILFTAHSGINLYYGWNQWTDGTWQQTELERTTGFSHQQLKRTSRIIDGREVSWSQASAHWTRKALAFIASNPGRTLWLLGRKFLLFWANYEVPNNYYPETAWPYSLALKLSFLNFGAIAALGIGGIFLSLRRTVLKRNRQKTGKTQDESPETGSLYLYPLLFVCAYLLSSLVFYVLSRLRAPVIPFLLMFAGYAVTETVAAAKAGKRLQVTLVLGLAALFYVGSNLVPIDRRTYSAQAWTQAGNTYMTMSNAQAFEAFRRALQANPANPVARYGLFVAYAGMGKIAEAEAEYEKLTRVVGADPRNRVLAELAGGRLAIARRDFSKARLHYLSAVTLDPLNAEHHYLLGLVFVSMDSLEQARNELVRTLQLDPNHEAARSSLLMVESHLATRKGESN